MVRRNGCVQRNRKPSASCDAKRRPIVIASLLERCAHREQRQRRERVRDRVEEKRQRPAEAEERAAEWRAAELHRRPPRLLSAGGGRKLLRRDDGAQRARLRGIEQGRAGPFDERDDEHDHTDAWPVRIARGQARYRRGTDGVRGDHQLLAVPTVGGGSATRPNSPNGVRRANATSPACADECDSARTSSG